MTTTLVVLPDDLTGLIASLPAVSLLAGSRRRLALAAPEEFHPLLALAWPSHLASTASPDLLESAAGVLTADCEEAVLLGGGRAAAEACRRAGLDRRWGYSKLLVPVDPAIPRPRGALHRYDRDRKLLLALGLEASEEAIPRLQIQSPLAARGRRLLERGGISERPAKLVGLVVSRADRAAPRWPWRRFVDLVRRLRREIGALEGILVADARDLWPAVRVSEETARAFPVVGPDLNLAELAGVLSHLDLLISPDGGLLHLAAATGAPTLALFGPGDPNLTAPRGPNHRALRGALGRIRGLSAGRVSEAAIKVFKNLAVGASRF